MKKCPFCAESIQDDAVKCRYCGEFLDDRPRQGSPVPPGPPGFMGTYWGYEYKSKLRLFGLPLVHIAQGIDPRTGRPRVAKGIIAIGNIAIGVIAMGGIALGALAFGGLGIGLIALGGLAVGVAAIGGVALAIYLAMGGLAVSAAYAIGGLAIAPHAIGANGVDRDFLDKLEKLWPGIRKYFHY